MSLWFQKNLQLIDLNNRSKNTAAESLGIEFTEIGDDFLRAKMPVDHRTVQPHGILHGGASVLLAETLASSAGNFSVDSAKQYCVGLEINANHIRSVRDGFVEATTRPVHVGRTTQVWETRIEQNSKLVCMSRMTLAVLNR